MSELVVFRTGLNLGGRFFSLLAFWIGRRDEADFPVEDAEQVVEVLRAAGVTRLLEQLGLGAPVALDVGAGVGQQRFEKGPGRFLVVAVFGRGRGRTERLLQEGHADALSAADFLQRGKRPRLALHHLGKQGQADTNDLAFLGQASNRLLKELLLVLADLVAGFWQGTESPAKCRQYLLGVAKREEIDEIGRAHV